MASWPSLPAPLFTVTRSAADGTLRSPVDSGPPMTRRIYTSTPKVVAVTLILTGAEAATLEAFYATTTKMGSIEFDSFPDPLDGTTTSNAVFGSRPVFRGLKGHATVASRVWEASFDVVIKP